MDNHRQEAGVEAPQEQEDIRVIQAGEGNGGGFAVPEGHGYRIEIVTTMGVRRQGKANGGERGNT